MKARTGKIARLPCPVREELNKRLESAEPGGEVLAWLNGLPEVRAILGTEFGGSPITKQNLSHWRQNGYRDWLARQDLRAGLGDACEMPDDLKPVEELEVIDSVAKVMAARLGILLTRWDGKYSPQFEGNARALNGLCQSVARLQSERNRSSGGKSGPANPCASNGSGVLQGSPRQSNHHFSSGSSHSTSGNAVAKSPGGGSMGPDNSQTQR